jgi:hypothetical protein
MEIDMKARVRRRTHAHVVRLQIKQGKRQPFKDDEDISESELPLEVDQKPLPVVLKIPNGPEKTSSRKKRGQSLTESTTPNLILRLTNKRRTSPECELSEILEKILADIIAIPEAGVFCRPVSQHHYPDYYELIKNPISLEQIRDKVRNFKYVHTSAFLEDMKLVAANCTTYNGPAHPLSALANEIYEKVLAAVEEVSFTNEG